jgi:hypothetical protein
MIKLWTVREYYPYFWVLTGLYIFHAIYSIMIHHHLNCVKEKLAKTLLAKGAPRSDDA